MIGVAAGAVILVVDDETLLRFYTVDIFADRGFATFEAANSAKALTALDDHPEITVLLTDINMPGSMNGLALAHEVRRRQPAIRLVIVSGQIRPRVDEMPEGSHFAAKPFTSAAILQLAGV